MLMLDFGIVESKMRRPKCDAERLMGHWPSLRHNDKLGGTVNSNFFIKRLHHTVSTGDEVLVSSSPA